jgi:uncharacterized protein YgiM (DUF1202 family)
MLARLAAISVIAFAGFTAVAAADEIAYTKSSANLREGPGTVYDVIATLPKNTELFVDTCTATWCAVTVEKNNQDGFIAKSLLKKSPSGPDIPFNIQIIIDPEGPFLDFGDVIVVKPEPPPKPQYPEVCFYQQANFKGANFCVEEGDEDNNIPGNFDNNIESILISGGLGVEVCSGVGHGGECFYYTDSRKNLPNQIRNKITSYMVDGGDGSSDGGDDFDLGDDDGGGFILLD